MQLKSDLLILVACTAMVPAVALAQAAASQPVSSTAQCYNIAAGSLADVLGALSKNSRTSIDFNARAAANLKSVGVTDRCSVQDALDQALSGTGWVASNKGSEWKVSRAASPAQARAGQLAEIVVTATNLSAMRTATPLREIPQSVAVVSPEQIEQQNDHTLDDVLINATGITLVQGGSNANYFYARGFPVTSIHIDGGPQEGLINNAAQPFNGLPDMGEYDHVEILRGADGLFGGNGNPSATVSLIRKEPLATPQLVTEFQGGSWNQYRAEVDGTGPIAMDGALRGRIDVVYGSQDYYYRLADSEKWKVFGVVAYDFNSHGTVQLGGSFQHLNTLPFDDGLPHYPDGSDPDLPRSTSLALPWNYYDTRSAEVYAKLNYDFGGGWKVKADLTYLHDRLTSAQTVFDAPVLPQSNIIAGQPTAFFTETPSTQNQLLADVTATGETKVFGTPVDIMFGADFVKYFGYSLDGGIQAFGSTNENIFNFNPADYPDPRNDPNAVVVQSSAPFSTINYGLYGSVRVHVTDKLALIGGARRSADDVNSNTTQFAVIDGTTYTLAPQIVQFRDHKITPYGGITYDLGAHLTAYASYADIYISNSGDIQYSGALVPPSDGVNIETGLKGAWYDGRLNGTFSIFHITQDNVATFDYTHLGSLLPNCCYVGGLNNRANGFELELAGKITADWMITAGYTYNDNSSTTGNIGNGALSSVSPKSLFKLWTNYRLPGRWSAWDVGGSLQAQSESYYQTTYFTGQYCGDGGPNCPPGLSTATETQGAYQIFNLRVGYKINKNLGIAASVNNVLDKNYYSTIGIPQSSNTYGNPRNFLIKLRGVF